MKTRRSMPWFQRLAAASVVCCAALVAAGVPAPVQAQTSLYSKTTSGSWTYTVPSNVYFVTVTVVGGGGGGGGWDASGKGGDGGKGASVTAVVGVTPGGALGGVVAAGGSGGASPTGASACTGGGAGGSGGASGGTGGMQSCGSGYSGGGGGGGGGGLNNPATTTGAGANATTLTGVAACAATAGSVGTNAPGDGGGGGGGGAGSTGGAGGTYGADNTTTPSTAGGGGGSCYLTSGTYVDAAAIATGAAGGTGATGYATGGSGTAGSVTITSLPSLLLQKTWGANSLSTDGIAVATTGGTKVASVSAAGSAAGGTTAGTRVYEKSGDAVTLPVETFTPAASSAKYVSTLTCTNATSPPTNAAPPRTITLTAADTAVVCTYTNAPKADLSIVKTTNTNPVVSGQAVSYAITVANAGPATATGAVVKDIPVSGITCPPANTVTCSGAACPGASFPVSTLLSGVTMGAMAAGSSATMTFSCNVN